MEQSQAFNPEDLAQAIMLIDEAVNQGAYKGWDNVQRAMTTRSRLLNFYQNWRATADAQAAQAAAAQAAQAPTAETEVATTTDDTNVASEPKE